MPLQFIGMFLAEVEGNRFFLSPAYWDKANKSFLLFNIILDYPGSSRFRSFIFNNISGYPCIRAAW